jgi:hypothetical protein
MIKKEIKNITANTITPITKAIINRYGNECPESLVFLESDFSLNICWHSGVLEINS